jgi:hypothetical protein
VLKVDCPVSVIDTWFLVVESWLSGVGRRVLRDDSPVSVIDTWFLVVGSLLSGIGY